MTPSSRIPNVVAVTVPADFVLRLIFDDGVEGTVDLGDELSGPVFEALRDPDYFRRVTVDPEIGTVVWPNGADLAPEVLHDEVLQPSPTPDG